LPSSLSLASSSSSSSSHDHDQLEEDLSKVAKDYSISKEDLAAQLQAFKDYLSTIQNFRKSKPVPLPPLQDLRSVLSLLMSESTKETHEINVHSFPIVMAMMEELVATPYSSASVERGFSLLNRIVRFDRTSLTEGNTENCVVFAANCPPLGTDAAEVLVTDAQDRWVHSAKRALFSANYNNDLTKQPVKLAEKRKSRKAESMLDRLFDGQKGDIHQVEVGLWFQATVQEAKECRSQRADEAKARREKNIVEGATYSAGARWGGENWGFEEISLQRQKELQMDFHENPENLALPSRTRRNRGHWRTVRRFDPSDSKNKPPPKKKRKKKSKKK
jgi:hypothetical protein